MGKVLLAVFLLFACAIAEFSDCGDPFHVTDATGSGSSVGYDPNTNTYLIVWVQPGSQAFNDSVIGQLYDEFGAPFGNQILVQSEGHSKLTPTVIFGTQWFVAWVHDATNTGAYLLTSTTISVNNGVARVGQIFVDPTVSTASDPFLTYNNVLDHFLLSFAGVGYTPHLHLFNGTGSIMRRTSVNVADSFAIKPRTTFNDLDNQYVLVWTSARGRPSSNIMGMILDTNLVAQGVSVLIGDTYLNGSTPLHDHDGSIDWDSIQQGYVLTWQSQLDPSDASWQDASTIYMRVLSNNLTVIHNIDLSGDSFILDVSSQTPQIIWASRTDEHVISYVTSTPAVVLTSLNQSLTDQTPDVGFLNPSNPHIAYNYRKNKVVMIWEDSNGIGGALFCGDQVPDIPPTISTSTPTSSSTSASTSRTGTPIPTGTFSGGAGTVYVEIIPPYYPPAPNGEASAERVTHIVVGVLTPIFGIPIFILSLMLFYFGYWKPKKMREAKLRSAALELEEKAVESEEKFQQQVDV